MNLMFSVPVLRGSAQLHAQIREGAGQSKIFPGRETKKGFRLDERGLAALPLIECERRHSMGCFHWSHDQENTRSAVNLRGEDRRLAANIVT